MEKVTRYIPTFGEFDGYKGMLPGEDDGYGISWVKYSDYVDQVSRIETALISLAQQLADCGKTEPCQHCASSYHTTEQCSHGSVSRIRTEFIHPPIPVRHFDWVAWIDGDEESGQYGHGTTEQEAKEELQNLLAQFDEENDSARYQRE